MENCCNLEKCGFVKKFESSNNLAVKGFIALYCKSAKQNECKRKEYKQKYGEAPVDEMMPNGLMFQ